MINNFISIYYNLYKYRILLINKYDYKYNYKYNNYK